MMGEISDGQTVKRKVKKLHWYRGQLYIIENVEAEVCPDCGERYFHAKVLDEIDRMLEAEHEVKHKLEVEVVSL